MLMTPSPFDPMPLKDKVLPKGAEKYSWMKPYDQYDDVLTRYSEWLLTYRDKGYAVADSHAAVLHHLTRMRKADPSYRVSGDGIHPDANGHLCGFSRVGQSTEGPARRSRGGSGFQDGNEFQPRRRQSHRQGWRTWLRVENATPVCERC